MLSNFISLFTALMILLPSEVFAIQWEVIGACSKTPLFQGSAKTNFQESVGKYSLRIFNENKIPFIGFEQGFNSIANSPVGLDALEVLSDNEMRAYGWCYSINGQIPDVMPDQLSFLDQDDKLTWFYAFSLNKNGEWINYCVPAWTVQSAQFCSEAH